MARTMDIKDDNHAKKILEELNRNRKEHCDFRIIAGTEIIPVHKNILSAGSDYFKAMLSHDKVETQTGKVEMQEVDPTHLKQCINYIYTGQISVTDESAESFMHVASLLQLKKVSAGITSSLASNLVPQSYFPTKRIASMYSCEELETKCGEFILDNFEEISTQEDFKEISENELTSMVKAEENKSSEKAKLNAIICWVKHKKNDRKHLLKKLDKFVNLQNISVSCRRFLLEKEPIVKTCMECYHTISMSVMDSMNVVASNTDSSTLTEKEYLIRPNEPYSAQGEISDGYESGNPVRVSEEEYMARNVFSAPTPAPRFPVSTPNFWAKLLQPSIAQEVISSIIDKDMYAYMKMVHSKDLHDIRKKFDVAFHETVVGDASKISFSPTNFEGNPQRAANALDELHNRVSNSVVQDVVKIDTKLSDETLKRIFASLCPEFPKVHMARVHNSPDNVIFTAPNQKKCTMATDMFKHFVQREIDMSTQSSPGSNANNAGTNMISVDKDIYGYLELVQSDTLNKIWSTNEVRIDTKTIDDCLEIRLRSTVPGRKYNPDLAIDQFQKLYNRIQDEAAQKCFDLGGQSISTNGIAQVLRMVRATYKDVYVEEMHGAGNNVLFIANKKERCDQAITTFGRLLNPYAK